MSTVTYFDIEGTLGRPLSITEQAQAVLWITDAEMLVSAALGALDALDADRLAYVVRESVADRFRAGISGGAESVSVSVDDSTVTRRYASDRGSADGDWLIDGWLSLLSKRQKGGPFSIMPWFEQDATA